MFCSVNEGCTWWKTRNDEILDSMKRERFDLAIVDGQVYLECDVYLIPHRLQVPWITYTHFFDPLTARLPWLPSFVPNGFLPYTDSMTFSQRLANSAAMAAFRLAVAFGSFTPPPEVIAKYQQYGAFSSIDELASRSLLWLYEKDSVLDYPRPMMPNVIEVGGLTIRRATGQLPSDIKKFIAGAENGVILMTFGSLASSYPVVIAEKFLSAFRRLDGYRVIWRMRNTDGLTIPNNVMIAQWLPQNENLSHSSVKLFITHCGNDGQHEAVYHGVPMIGFHHKMKFCRIRP